MERLRQCPADAHSTLTNNVNPRLQTMPRDRDLGCIQCTDKSKRCSPYAVFCVTNPSSLTIASRIKNFCGLPVTVIGSSVRKRMWRGIL